MRVSLFCLWAWLLLVVPSVPALARPFVIGGQTVELAEVSATVEAYFGSMRLNQPANQWNFDLRLRNTAVAPLAGTVVVVVESSQNTSGALSPDGRTEDGKAWFDVSSLLPAGGLATGQTSAARTLALGITSGSPALTVKVFAGAAVTGPALGFVRTLDAQGLPLPGVTVTEAGPEGDGVAKSDARFGVATIGQGAGLNTFRFEAAGYLPVWRTLTLAAGSVRELPSPRLTPRATNSLPLSPLGGVVSNVTGALQITVPAGALNAAATATLTPLTAQTLPALLPAGWSPLQGFWLELSAPTAGELPARLELWGTLAPDEPGALVHWNPATQLWEVAGQVSGLGSAVVNVNLSGAGAWAFVVGDAAPNSPPAPQLGEPLPAAAAATVDWAAITAGGRVTPQSNPASRQAELVTATGELVISNRVGVLRSGTLLRGAVSERYELRDGSVRVTPAYETYFVGYQRPGDQQAATLQAALPLRPQLLLGADELLRGTITVDIFPPSSFGGAVFLTTGGAARQESVELNAGQGTVARSQAVQLALLGTTNFASLAADGLEIARAFQVTLGELAPGAHLGLQVSGLSSNAHYVLARVLVADGVYGLEPVERLVTDAAGKLASAEPAGEPRLPGLDGAGQYVLARVAGPQALVTGIARNASVAPAQDFVVQLPPWTTVSDGGGRYRVLAPPGTSQVVVTDRATGQRGAKPVAVAAGQTSVDADVSTANEGPRVLAVNPGDGATNVPVIASVEITFSKPLNPVSTIGDALQLLDAANQPVAVSVGFNLRGDVATLLPLSPLTNAARHTLKLSTNLADFAGLKLAGSNVFSFTTVPTAAPRVAGAQLISFEPTNGVARLQGTAGIAEPGRPVVLVNETTGRTVTVLAGVDGSFTGAIAAAVDDALRVTLVNGNGTVNSVPVSRQVFADGSVALFSEGGTIEVPGEHGPIQFLVEPGSLNGKTKFKFASVPLTNVLTVVSNTQPEGGRILGGVRVSAIAGNPMNESMDVAFPVNVADLQLPAGVSPTNCAFGLAIARLVDDAPVFELVDRMHYEDGKLVTHSPPFFGLFGPFEDILVLPLLMFTAEVPLMVHGQVFAAEVDPGTGRPLAGAEREFLAGAIVSGRGKAPASGLRGRLRPGTVYSSTGPDGKYTLMVVGDATSAAKPVAVTATHPRFPNQEPQSVVPDLSSGDRFAIGNLLTGRDIVFPKTGGALDVPPTFNLSQSPALPAVGADVTVSVVVTDDSTVPFVHAEVANVAALATGGTPSLADVTFLEGLNESVGATARRREFTVRSARAQVVNLRILGVDGNGNERTLTYPVVFGAQPPPPADNPPVSDTNDRTGPTVVGMSPSPGSSGLVSGQPIVLRFNEPIRREVLTADRAVTLEPFGGVPRLELNADQTQLSVLFPLLRTNAEYTLTLGYAVQDLARNLIDQRPGEPGSQTFTATFRTAATVVSPLPEIGRESGAGAFLHGNYALVAERRGSDRGRVAVFDLSTPATPQLVNEISLPPFPREILFLPNYAFVYTNGLAGSDGRELPVTLDTFTNPGHPNRAVRTNDLLVAVGGLAGQGQLQWLRVIDVSNPLRPQLLVGMLIGQDGLALPGRLRWSAPTLAYLETASPDRISLLNLQSLIVTDLLSSNQGEYRKLPADGQAGNDRNGDGDYVDANETVPLPPLFPAEFGGKELALALPDTDQTMLDFVVEEGGAYLGAVLSTGRELGPDGRPQDDRPVAAAFRTLLNGGIAPPRVLASFEFPANRRPRRAETLFQFPVQGTNGLALRDLVLVGLAGNRQLGETNNFLTVLDLTDRLAVRQLVEIPLPKDGEEGGINSIQRRDDGLITVAGDRLTYLLDPSQFHLPLRLDGSHPALVGTVEGLGGYARRFDSALHGYHVAAEVGGKAQVVQTAPLLSFVGFPGRTPVSPATLVGRGDAELDALLGVSESRQFLLPARLREAGDCGAALLVTNLDPRTHHYVLAYAPGGAGPTIELALESLNWAGYPLRKRGFLFPPVHALGAEALEKLGQEPAEDEAPVRSLRAWRLSANPVSPFYNVYLSRPFVLVADEISREELAALRAQLDREILWSGHGLRVSLDVAQKDNPVLGPFVGQVDLSERVHKPGVEITADTFSGDLLQSPNPGPVTGEMLLPLALNSVGAHNSELVINATDLVLMGRRMPFEFRRTFRGQSLYDGPFGRGWDFSFNQRLVELPVALDCLTLVARPDPADREVAQGGDLLFHTGGGQVVVWRFAGTNAPAEIAADPLIQQLGWLPKVARFYLPPAGLFSPMLKFKDGRYVRLEPDGRQYWFNPAGRLERMYDRYEKNFFALTYNARGELTRIENEGGKAVEFGYYRIATDPEFRAGLDEAVTRLSDVGRICRLKDWSDRDVRYTYSADGLLEKFQGPEVTTGPAEAFHGRPETVYRYSGSDRPARSAKSLIAVDGSDVGGAPVIAVAEQAARGRDTVAKLNLMGQSVVINQPHTNTAAGLADSPAPTEVTSQDSSVSRMKFDRLGRVTEAVLAGANDLVVTNRQEYFPDGPLRGLVRATVSALGDRTEFLYDEANPSLRSRGNLKGLRKVPGPRGGPVLTASTEYDPFYNLPSGAKRDFNGVETTVVLAGDRRSVERISRGGERELFTVNEYGQPATHTAMEGTFTRFDYNGDGYLSARTVGTRQTRFLYGPVTGGAGDPGKRGKPSQVIGPDNIPTTFVHDELDRLVQQEREGARTVSAFDAVGNLKRRTTTVEADRQAIEEFDYLSHGFLREQRLKNVETDGALADLVTTFERDELSRVKSVTFPNGQVRRFFYDYQSRLEREEVPGSHTNQVFFDAVGNVTNVVRGAASERYVYDGHNRLVSVLGANGTATEYVRDGNGNVTTNRVRSVEGTLLSEVRFEFDELNRLRKKILLRDDGESVLTTDYNSGERSITVTDALGSRVKTFLDDEGRAGRVEGPNHTLELTRDPGANVSRRQLTDDGGVFVSGYGYNTRNQLMATTNSLGEVARYVRALDGRQLQAIDREQHATTNEFTLLGEVSALFKPNGVSEHHQFDAGRNLALFRDAADNLTRYQHDAQSRLVTNRLPNHAETVFSGFNAFGLPTRIAMPRGVLVEARHDFEGKLTNRVVTGFGPRREERFEYDGLRRYRRITDPSGTLEFDYDLAGFIRQVTREYRFGSSPTAVAPLTFAARQQTDAGLFRSGFEHPVDGFKLTYQRDGSGRLKALLPEAGEPVIKATTWLGDARFGSRTLGDDRIRLDLTFDGLPRLAGRRYTRVSDGAVLVDVRQAHDRNGAVLARQYVHRGGRADVFHYDSGYRLLRADLDARPTLAGETPSRPVADFSLPAGVGGTWQSGFAARVADYLDTDLLRTLQTFNPLGVSLPPLAADFSGANAFLAVTNVDGFAREVDEIGNVTRTRLAVRLPSQAQPQLVAATLVYNDLGQLVRVEREDGVTVFNEYDQNGLRIRRAVTGPAALCVPSDVAFLYDGIRLIEERDLTSEAALLRRYFYSDDGDDLVAAEVRESAAEPFRRVYLLTDNQRSVLALADGAGAVIERRRYDPWGQPVIEAPDTTAPAVSWIRREANGLLIAFSEPVLPTGAADSGVITNLPSLAGRLQLKVGGAEISGQFVPDDSVTPAGFGSAIRFVADQPLAGAGELTVVAGALRDDWGNPNGTFTLAVNLDQPAGAQVTTSVAPGSTAPVQLGRTATGVAILFHGQLYDEDTGLLYCRARFYDPYTASFLQRDPAGFVDSVNPYTAFANNPVSFRDPTGASIADDMRQMGETLQEDADKHRESGGFVNLALSMAEEGFAGLLQMPAATRDSWNVLQSESQGGTLDLLNRMKAAEVVGKAPVAAIGVVASGVGAMHTLKTASSFLAQKARGLASTLARRTRMVLGRGTAVDFLMTQGLTRWEAEGYVNTLALIRDHYKSDQVEAAVRGFGKKANLRRENRERLMAVKPEWAKTKTADVDAAVNISLKQADGSVIHREFTGDLDFYYIKVNGRRLEEHEFQQFKHVFNREMTKAYRHHGGTGNPGASVLHGAHLNLPELQGRRVEHLGADTAKKPFYARKGGGEAIYEMLPHSRQAHYDMDLMDLIGGPGPEAFSVRLDGLGRVQGFNPEVGVLRRELDEVAREFRWATGIELGEHGWYNGFDKHLPSAE
jgi:RHS repeat-associated protein